MKNKPQRYFMYLWIRVIIFVIRLLPRRVALALGYAVGTLGYYLVRRERRKVLKHLRFAWQGEKSEREIRFIAKGVFQNLVMTAVDAALFTRLNKSNLRDWLIFDDEFARVNRILDQGRGMIVVTGHIGNWELLAAAFGIMGYPSAAIGRRIYYEKFNEMIVKMREQVNLRTIYRDSSPKEMLKVLRNNQLLGVLPDQDVSNIEGIFVDFFGRPAYTPTSPVKLAMAAQTAMVPVFVFREGQKYRLVMEEAIYPQVGPRSREEAVREYTERWCAVIERYIRKYPEQWVWMHDRWRTSPEQKEEKKISMDQFGGMKQGRP